MIRSLRELADLWGLSRRCLGWPRRVVVSDLVEG